MAKKIEKIIIHHSDSEFGDFETINGWHKKRGWGNPKTGISCGYNGLILNGKSKSDSKYNKLLDGIIHPGRGSNMNDMIELSEVGAHALGHNSTSLGWCLIGKNQITKKQFETLAHVLHFYRAMWPWVEIVGHSRVNRTLCPGFDVPKWLESVGL
jgi:hypothetical protein